MNKRNFEEAIQDAPIRPEWEQEAGNWEYAWHVFMREPWSKLMIGLVSIGGLLAIATGIGGY